MSSKFMQFLLGVERIALTAAAGAAIFPLLQFYNERDARAIDRAATFISAYSTCAEIKGWDALPDIQKLQWMTLGYGKGLPDDLAEIPADLKEKIEAINKYIRDLSKTIDVQCDFIKAENENN